MKRGGQDDKRKGTKRFWVGFLRHNWLGLFLYLLPQEPNTAATCQVSERRLSSRIFEAYRNQANGSTDSIDPTRLVSIRLEKAPAYSTGAIYYCKGDYQ